MRYTIQASWLLTKEMSMVMSEKEPEPQDFGITYEEYNRYYGLEELALIPPLIVASAVFLALFAYLYFFVDSQDLGTSFGTAIFPSLFLLLPIIGLAQFVTTRYYRYRLSKANLASQIELYHEAWTTYEATRKEAERAEREAERAEREAEREAERVRLETERTRREADRPRREAEKARLEAQKARQRKLQEVLDVS